MHVWATMVLLGAAVSAGCSPEFNWREVRFPEIGAAALFPCKPGKQARQVPLAGGSATWTLHACDAGESTFALASADLDHPARVPTGLRELAEAARRNLGADAMREAAASVPGVAGSQAAQRLELQGRRSDGAALSQEALLFSHGTRVYQATVLGARTSAEVRETFLSSIRVGP